MTDCVNTWLTFYAPTPLLALLLAWNVAVLLTMHLAYNLLRGAYRSRRYLLLKKLNGVRMLMANLNIVNQLILGAPLPLLLWLGLNSLWRYTPSAATQPLTPSRIVSTLGLVVLLVLLALLARQSTGLTRAINEEWARLERRQGKGAPHPTMAPLASPPSPPAEEVSDA